MRQLEELHRELHVDEAATAELGIVPAGGFVGNFALHALAHRRELPRGRRTIDRPEQARFEHFGEGAVEERFVPGDGARP